MLCAVSLLQPSLPCPRCVARLTLVSRACATGVLSKTERVDTSRIALTGFSAGGNLALSVSNSLGPSLISAVATFYAPTNFTLGDGVKRAPEGQPFKPLVWVFRQFALAYLPKGTRREHPRLSVLFAPPERYPGTVLCICGARDTLHEDSVRLCKRLQEAGGQDVEFISAPGRRHGCESRARPAAIVSLLQTG